MAGGMNKRGRWGPMADRVRQGGDATLATPGAEPAPAMEDADASPATPAVPLEVKHCWVSDHNGRLPGLLLAWRRVSDSYEGRVVRLVWVDEGWSVVAEWLPASMLEKA